MEFMVKICKCIQQTDCNMRTCKTAALIIKASNAPPHAGSEQAIKVQLQVCG